MFRRQYHKPKVTVTPGRFYISDYFSELLSNDNKTEFSLWRATKRLKRPVLQKPPIRVIDGTWTNNNIQKATVAYLEENEGKNNIVWEKSLTGRR